MTDTRLPVADRAQVRRATWELLRGDKPALTIVVILYSLSAIAGLAAPWLLGEIIDRVDAGAGFATVDALGLAIGGFLLAQLLLDRFGRYLGHRFGERALARLREDFVDDSLRLPVSVVERAGSGDLMTRSTGDVNSLGTIVRQALPEIVIGAAHVLFILVAVIALNPLFSLFTLLMLAPLWLIMRWYLRRARAAYLAQAETNTEVSEAMAATAAGARTVEAFGLTERRIAVSDATVAESTRTRMHTLWLRTVMFPVADFSYVLPTGAALFFGGLAYVNDLVTLGAVIAAALYLQQLVRPLDQILMWIEQLQQGGAAFARIRGVAEVEPDRVPSGEHPGGDAIEVRGVHYGYTPGRDVLHGIDLSLRPGEHLAIVGPSGAGKSTLGRLLAGVEAPGSGSITVGGVEVTDLDQTELRRRIALVTQDHHVFIGSLRDNLILAEPDATDAQVHAALDTVGADWVAALPAGLDTELGPGHTELDAPQAQQLALARLILADPHTLILDEATSLLDPTAAREAERALSAVLRGRTVIAIAHRLHAAHDADRVAIVDGGRITELGSHAELVAADGSYAALWRSWHGD